MTSILIVFVQVCSLSAKSDKTSENPDGLVIEMFSIKTGRPKV